MAAHVSQQDVDELMENLKNRINDPLEGLSLLAAVAQSMMVITNLRMLEYVDPEGRGIRLTCLPETGNTAAPPHQIRGRQLH